MSKLESKLNGVDLFGEPLLSPSRGVVSDEFGFPPFSVLDARQGAWQARKKSWINLGIDSEKGRSAECNASTLRPLTGDRERMVDKGVSVFDPVLCECLYNWFCPKNGQVVDPFAGGSVRGVVAGMLGRKYWGSDLREEQIDANKEQAVKINPINPPEWVCGDSMNTLEGSPKSDFIFSCPPYGDLEKYSDDPGDLSSMEWHTFKAAYSHIILKSVKKLKNDRFACFVVGDFRDKKGFYRDFVSATIMAFRNAGAELYNEAILLTPLGNAAMRCPAFIKSKKMIKVHQNVLIFCKGDPKKATKAITESEES